MASRFLVAIGAILLSACSVGGAAIPEQSQQHAALTYITDDMVVPKTAFPSGTGGEFRFTPVEARSASEDETDVCSIHNTQEAGARITGGEPTYIIEIFAVTERVDLKTLFGSCVAADDEEIDFNVSGASVDAVPGRSPIAGPGSSRASFF
ncbi:hypothetical protein ACFUEJ_23545 [Gordonia sp. NPDC057258]|uniref:hypothetical protein n=1 Tax=unclassified Gordonia (in: high G+C Gram-positive bacteria) TaxID=2657482 RepID=UPI003634768E